MVFASSSLIRSTKNKGRPFGRTYQDVWYKHALFHLTPTSRYVNNSFRSVLLLRKLQFSELTWPNVRLLQSGPHLDRYPGALDLMFLDPDCAREARGCSQQGIKTPAGFPMNLLGLPPEHRHVLKALQGCWLSPGPQAHPQGCAVEVTVAKEPLWGDLRD